MLLAADSPAPDQAPARRRKAIKGVNEFYVPCILPRRAPSRRELLAASPVRHGQGPASGAAGGLGLVVPEPGEGPLPSRRCRCRRPAGHAAGHSGQWQQRQAPPPAPSSRYRVIRRDGCRKELAKSYDSEIKHSNKICFLLPRQRPDGKSRSRQQDLPATAPCHGMHDWSERSPFPPFRPHPCNQERKCCVLRRYALPALLGLTLLASGCAGGFSRHYQAADDHVRPVDTLESCSAPRVEQLPSSVMEKRLAAALADGYVRLGRATWESAVPASADDAVAQAGRVGACLVLQSVTPIPQQPEKAPLPGASRLRLAHRPARHLCRGQQREPGRPVHAACGALPQ